MSHENGFKMSITAQHSLTRLQTAFSDKAQFKTTIYSWFEEIKRGRVILREELRDGHLSTVMGNKNIDAVHRVIDRQK